MHINHVFLKHIALLQKNEGHSYCGKYLQGNECILSYIMLQVSTGATANMQTFQQEFLNVGILA